MQPFALDGPIETGITLLEASAGTGKTYSIAALCLRMVAELGISVSELLVVTFTKAATAELRDRIRRRLADGLLALDAAIAGEAASEDPVLAHLVADPEALGLRRHRLEAALAAFDTATISTIHGFCQRTLQSAAFETGSDLDLELIESDQEILREVVEDFFHTYLVDTDDQTHAHAVALAGMKVEDAIKVAKRLLDEPALPLACAEVEVDDLHRHLREMLAQLRDLWAREGEALLEWLERAPMRKNAVLRTGFEHIAGEARRWLDRRTQSPRDPSRIGELCTRLSAQGINSATVKAAGPLPDHFELPRHLDRMNEEVPAAWWSAFAAHLRREVPARKARAGVMAFDDLLQNMAAALDDPARCLALQRTVRAEYRAALIDEFQDTDRRQWSIFSRLFDAEDHYLFLIGDPKQSIYRFRGADIDTYLDARKAAHRSYALNTNFRSDRGVVEALNALYALDPVLAPGIEYEPVGAHHEGPGLRDAEGRALEPLVLTHFPPSPYSSGRSAAEHQRITYAQIGDRVVEALSSGLRLVRDEPDRPLTPGDIAILVNNHGQATGIEAELRRRGVPAVRRARKSVFETDESRWVSLALDAWLAPRNAKRSRALLASPLMRDPSAPPLDTLEAQSEALEAALARNAHYAELWTRHGFARAWRAFASDLGLALRLADSDEGARAWANYEHLAELLHREQMQSRLGPLALSRFLAERRQSNEHRPESELMRLDRDDDAVEIATVHASKGLEYPVVFLPFAPAAGSLKDRALVSDLDGRRLVLGPIGGPAWKAAAKLEGQRAQEEARRRLYVALTRARHRLHVDWGNNSTSTLKKDGLMPLLAAGAPKKFEPEQLREIVVETLGGLGDHIEAHAIEDEPEAGSWSPPAVDDTPLAAREFTRMDLDRAWRRASYSSLVHGATQIIIEGSPEAEGQDLDPRELEGPGAIVVDNDEGSGADTDDGALPLAGFARGTDAGTFLHAFLERVDFAELDDEASFEALLEETMSAHGIAAQHLASLRTGLRACIETPWGGPLGEWCLAQLGRRDRIDELAFELPIAGGYASREPSHAVRAADFAAAIARTRSPSPAFPPAVLERWQTMEFSAPARGFLTGSIDLFMRAPDASGQLRYFVVDYKSNWLGEPDRIRSGPSHYAPPRLVEAMQSHDYHLQYHLYALAAHRHLRARLGSSYDPARDFGGVYYLFLRGMIGADTPRSMSGESYGVFFDRPEDACLDALDALFHDPSGAGQGGRR